MAATFSQSLSSHPAAIAVLAEAVETWAAGLALPSKTVFEINLILDELISNVIEHGYAGRDDGLIEVAVEYADGAVTLEVTDHAAPFDLLELDSPDLDADLDSRRIGGLGVHFVRQLADAVDYRRLGDSNVVRVHKRIEGAA
ncbi:ATP-binding protein [Chitinimonas lacunae]|uniref:ATP-binding protein n=1 Tax=Chitinimonas lacunae TaxID=1963018 RepID=A0ABV8MSX5_9NEIS